MQTGKRRVRKNEKSHRRRSSQYSSIVSQRSQRIQRIGSCMVLMGVPLSIMGFIFTIVAYGNSDKRLPGFLIAGPLLITMSIISFVVGFLMFQMTEKHLASCYERYPDSKNGFCLFLLCFLCNVLAHKRSSSRRSRELIDSRNTVAQPRSILTTSALLRDTKKPSQNHVRFGDCSESEAGVCRERTSSSSSSASTHSSSSLQRHCRVHPSPNLSATQASGPAQGKQPVGLSKDMAAHKETDSGLNVSPPASVSTGTLSSTVRELSRPASVSEVLPVFTSNESSAHHLQNQSSVV